MIPLITIRRLLFTVNLGFQQGKKSLMRSLIASMLTRVSGGPIIPHIVVGPLNQFSLNSMENTNNTVLCWLIYCLMLLWKRFNPFISVNLALFCAIFAPVALNGWGKYATSLVYGLAVIPLPLSAHMLWIRTELYLLCNQSALQAIENIASGGNPWIKNFSVCLIPF